MIRHSPMHPFRKKHITLADIVSLQKRLRQKGLNTVCESARCPNIGECFCSGTATFLIAGKTCTRACRFCAVDKGLPASLDAGEPGRVAEMVRELGIRYAVITSVTRDDLPDGGAGHYVAVIEAVRAASPDAGVEVLVPDFKGDTASAEKVFRARPDVFAHNLETVPSLYAAARAGADYSRSLALLSRAKTAGLVTKSGIMLGLGEKRDEVLSVLNDLRVAGCDILTIGQYLAPSKEHLPVKEYIDNAVFARYREEAQKRGFLHCESGSYVRSSYRAHTYFDRTASQNA